jgi:ABC-type amino acid transport substrate-binding protein
MPSAAMSLPYSLATAKGITRWDQLKGKRIAISRFGSGTDTAIRLVLTRFGLNPDKDVTIVQLDAQPSRFAALVAGGIEATLVAPPFDVTAKKQGFPILVFIWPAMMTESAPPEREAMVTGPLVSENFTSPAIEA